MRLQCHEHLSIFRRVWVFLRNPFAQEHEYECEKLSWPSFQISQIGEAKLPVMLHSHSQEPYQGLLGLSGDSDFLRALPDRYHSFSLFINSNSYGRVSRLDLGGYDHTSLKHELLELPVASTRPWSLHLDHIELFGVKFNGGRASLSTTDKKIGLPR